MLDNLLIFQKTYDFVVWLYFLINRLPKSHRPILGNKIHTLALDVLIAMIQANRLPLEKERSEIQANISVNIDTLRILLRLTKDLKLMSIKQYTYATKNLNEIARMHKSWSKCV